MNEIATASRTKQSPVAGTRITMRIHVLQVTLIATAGWCTYAAPIGSTNACAAMYHHCGGMDHSGSIVKTPCCNGWCSSTCEGCNKYWHMCLDGPPPPPSPPRPPFPPRPPPYPPSPPPPPFPPLSGPFGGFHFLATSTAFGEAAVTSCGGIASARDIRLKTGFIPIAAAQSMMEPYMVADEPQQCSFSNCGGGPLDDEGRCTFSAKTACELSATNGGYCDISKCNCEQPQGSSCACGRGSAPTGRKGTAPLGCFKCAVGRMLQSASLGLGSQGFPASMCSDHRGPRLGYNASLANGRVFQFVVIDTCPNSVNAKWCPAREGETNQCGVHNHFDIAMQADDLGRQYGWVENYIAFDVIDCPSQVIKVLKEQVTWSPGQCDPL